MARSHLAFLSLGEIVKAKLWFVGSLEAGGFIAAS